jgi:hypothetical protein
MKITAEVIHKLQYTATAFDTELNVAIKHIEISTLYGFSTEIAATIITSF